VVNRRNQHLEIFAIADYPYKPADWAARGRKHSNTQHYVQTYPWIGQIGSNALVTTALPDSINLISVSLSSVIPRTSDTSLRVCHPSRLRRGGAGDLLFLPLVIPTEAAASVAKWRDLLLHA